jgi:predicted CopG family antitoxin
MGSKYKTIRIREDLYELVRRYKEKTGASISQIIAKALAFMDLQERKPRVKEDLPLADKYSWYIAKVLMSAGAFKEDPSEINYRYLIDNLETLEERLGIETGFAKEVVNRLAGKKKEHWTVDDKIEFNSAMKSLVLQMLWRLEEDVERSRRQVTQQ